MSEAILPPPTNNDEPKMLAHESPFKKWGGLFVLSLGLAIIIIDTTLLNVSLTTIIKDLNTDFKSIQWVITAYALVLAAFTITGGRIGDLFGRKKMFMLGAIIFAVGSFMASESHALSTLLWGESIIEGFGAALMMPATASLVVANFKGKDRATAFGVWGGVAGASSAIGPLLGGYLTSHYSWRWGFRINIFVAALVIIGTLLLIKDSRDEEHKPQMDWIGVLLSSLGLLGITYGVIESESYGWWKAKEIFSLFGHQLNLGGYSITPICIALGLILIALFLWWERKVEARGRQPLVSLSLLKNRQFTSGSLTVMILTLGMTGLVFALPVFLQTVKNLDAFHTGLALLPLSATLLVVSPLAAFLSKKISPTYLIQGGLLLTIIAMFILRATINVDMPVWHLIPGLIVYGTGMGLVMAPISNLTLSAVPVQMSGEASGVNNTLRQVGATLGASIIGAAVLTSMTGHLINGVQNSQALPDPLKSKIIQKANQSSGSQFGAVGADTQAPQYVSDELKNLGYQASAQATKDGYVYAGMFLLLGFAVSLFLPKIDVHAHDEHGQHIVDESEYRHSPRKYAGAIALAIVAIGGAAWLLHRSSRQTISTGTVADAHNIRQLFADRNNAAQDSAGPVAASIPDNQGTNVEFAPNPFGQTASSTPQVEGAATITPVQNFGEATISGKPRGESSAVTSAPAAPTSSPKIYTSNTMNFQITLPANWQASENGEGKVTFASASGGQIYVQSYSAGDLMLSDVETQLRGSPSVTNISPSSFYGNPALAFKTTSGQNAWAFIKNDRLFYIFGGSLSSQPLSSMKFL